MNKFFILSILTVFLLSFAFSLSFPGKSISFSDLNMPLVYSNTGCIPFNFTPQDKSLLLDTPGILGIMLHIKSEDPDAFFYLQSNLGTLYKKNVFGFNIEHRNFVSETQNGYLFIYLEPVRSEDLTIYFCVSSSSKIELYPDSQIGTYRIPYFGGDNFVKEFMNDNYKIGEKTPVEVKLKNSGYGLTNIFLFYDNELFTKWFDLKDGTPSVTDSLEPGDETSLIYNLSPKTDKSFTVSPAVLRYDFNGYVFTEYSNGLISNARNYLDEIFLNINLTDKELTPNSKSILNIELLNDSEKNKDAVLLISGLEQFNLDDRYQVSLKPFEKKQLSYELTSPVEKIVTLNISLIAGENEKLEKVYDSQTISFENPLTNNNYIYVILAFVLVVGIIVYYKYGL